MKGLHSGWGTLPHHQQGINPTCPFLPRFSYSAFSKNICLLSRFLPGKQRNFVGKEQIAPCSGKRTSGKVRSQRVSNTALEAADSVEPSRAGHGQSPPPAHRGPWEGLFKCKAVNKTNFLKAFLTLFKVNTRPAMQCAELGLLPPEPPRPMSLLNAQRFELEPATEATLVSSH